MSRTMLKGEFYFRMSAVQCRIDEASNSPILEENVSSPKITVNKCGMVRFDKVAVEIAGETFQAGE